VYAVATDGSISNSFSNYDTLMVFWDHKLFSSHAYDDSNTFSKITRACKGGAKNIFVIDGQQCALGIFIVLSNLGVWTEVSCVRDDSDALASSCHVWRTTKQNKKILMSRSSKMTLNNSPLRLFHTLSDNKQ